MTDSPGLFKEILRSFTKSFFKVVGFGAGIIAVIMLFGIATEGKQPSASLRMSPRILPNHQWSIENYSPTLPTLLQINIKGVVGASELTADMIRTQLVESQNGMLNGSMIKGIMLVIDTPGGAVFDADSIYRMIKAYKEAYKVPVYAFVDGLCASGGTYIACAADKILATDTSLIGHVGVLQPTFFNYSQLLDKLGIQTKTITAGKNKDDMNPFRPWKPGEEESYVKIANYFYNRFLNIVTENRPKIIKEQLIEEGAQVYPAPIAEELGYIDERVSSLEEATEKLAKAINVEDKYQVVELEVSNWIAELMQAKFSSVFKNKMEHTLRIPGELAPELQGQYLYMYFPSNE